MIDSATKRRIVVSDVGMGTNPYIMLLLDQLASIERVLSDNQINYWVDSDTISLDGDPPSVVITLDRGTDVSRVQQLLDAVGNLEVTKG